MKKIKTEIAWMLVALVLSVGGLIVSYKLLHGNSFCKCVSIFTAIVSVVFFVIVFDFQISQIKWKIKK